METVKLSQLIEDKIKLLEAGRKELKTRAERKAETIAEYDRRMAITMIELKNGVEVMWEGQKIQNPPATIIEKIAKGLCWQSKLEMEKAEAFYKNAIVGLHTITAELNGLQSVNRYLSEM